MSAVTHSLLSNAFLSTDKGAIKKVLETVAGDKVSAAAEDALSTDSVNKEAATKYDPQIAKNNRHFVYCALAGKDERLSYDINNKLSMLLYISNKGGEGLVQLRGNKSGVTNLNTLPLSMKCENGLPNKETFFGKYLLDTAEENGLDLSQVSLNKVETHCLGGLVPLDGTNTAGEFCPRLKASFGNDIVKVIHYFVVSRLGIWGRRAVVCQRDGIIYEINNRGDGKKPDVWRMFAISNKTDALVQEKAKDESNPVVQSQAIKVQKLLAEEKLMMIIMVCRNSEVAKQFGKTAFEPVRNVKGGEKCSDTASERQLDPSKYKITQSCYGYSPQSHSASSNGSASSTSTASNSSASASAASKASNFGVSNSVSVHCVSKSNRPSPYIERSKPSFQVNAVDHTNSTPVYRSHVPPASSDATTKEAASNHTPSPAPQKANTTQQTPKPLPGAVTRGIISEGSESTEKIDKQITAKEKDLGEQVYRVDLTLYTATESAGEDNIARDADDVVNLLKLAVVTAELDAKAYAAK